MDEQGTLSQEEEEEQADGKSGRKLATKRLRLTRKNLARFDKMGNDHLDSTDSADVDCDMSLGSTKTISASSSAFFLQARKNGVHIDGESPAPANHGARRKRAARSRGTPSPTASEHGRFVKKIRKAGNEATVTVQFCQDVLKSASSEDYAASFNRAFTGLPQNLGFNDGLSAPQPDFVAGTVMESYLPFAVDEYLSGAVLYKEDPYSVTLAHLAGEWKGPNIDLDKATRQGGYDGAALVYARHQALSYLGKPDPPSHAEVTTFTANGKALEFYSHYRAQTEDGAGALDYHQHREASYDLREFDQYKAGRRHFRNVQDDAEDESRALRDQLKEHWRQQQQRLRRRLVGRRGGSKRTASRLRGQRESPPLTRSRARKQTAGQLNKVTKRAGRSNRK